MRCPECRTNHESDAAICSNCGLILFKLSAPARRSEDRAAWGRRAADREQIDCPSCRSTIPGNVLRCPQCTHIVNSGFRREVIDRRRAQINYASWVAYLGGLAMFLLFKPAGLTLIAIGLVLSVLYYAIPAHISDEELEQKAESAGFLQRALRQLRVERVFLPLPHLRKARVVLVGTPILAIFVGYTANFLLLQRPMNDILRRNQSFNGMSVATHYKWFVKPGEVVYDLRTPGDGLGPLHVQAALLEFARARVNGGDRKIELHWQGQPRFVIAGNDFREIGRRYAAGDFEYALLALPRLVIPAPGGTDVKADDGREALKEFHRIWYGEAPPVEQPATLKVQSSASASS